MDRRDRWHLVETGAKYDSLANTRKVNAMAGSTTPSVELRNSQSEAYPPRRYSQSRKERV